MQAGRLTQSVKIQKKTVTGQSSIGSEIADWESNTLGPFRAEVRALEGGELARFQQRFAQAQFIVTIRYPIGALINRTDRIAWGTRILDILDAEDPDKRQRRRELRIICRELVA